MNKNAAEPKISIVLPAFNEECNVGPCYERLVSALLSSGVSSYELIFVDDNSSDGTYVALERLRKRDGCVEILRLSKNCGSHAAIGAGLSQCRGAAAVVTGVDMQDPIESVLPQMISSWVGGRKVVWGVRERRGGEDLATRAFSKMFYYLINRITSVRQPYFSIGAFLLDRDVIDALNRISEKNSSVVMEVAWLGFAQECIYYCSEARHTGKSKWTFAKKLKLFIDSVVSFSYVPMRFMSLFGLICTVLGAVYGVYIFVDRLLHSVAVEGWSSLMIAVLMIGGVQMIMLGVLGEYLWRAYDEMRPRPRYVIEKSTISGQGM